MGDPHVTDSSLPAAAPADEPPEFAHLLSDDDGDTDAPPTVMRDIEKSLVERIADVDDERRRTSTQIRKALGVHRDEVDHRLRSYRHLLTATLVGLALVAGVLIWLVIAWSSERARLGQQLAELEQQLQRTATVTVTDAAPAQPVEGEIAALRERAQAVTAEVKALERALASSEQRLQQKVEELTGMLEVQPVQAPVPARDERQAGALAALEERVNAIAAEWRSMTATLRPSPDTPQPDTPIQAQTAPTQPGPDDLSPDQLRPDQPRQGAEDTADQTTLAEPRIALQLIGYHSRDDVQQFIATHRLPREIYLRSESYRGRPWYALIYGLYDDAEAAGAARTTLPESLARLDIWLRELPAGTTLERISTRAAD